MCLGLDPELKTKVNPRQTLLDLDGKTVYLGSPDVVSVNKGAKDFKNPAETYINVKCGEEKASVVVSSQWSMEHFKQVLMRVFGRNELFLKLDGKPIPDSTKLSVLVGKLVEVD